ncbi:type II toxin-antitoxin system RelE/ParE family toxin [Roseiarcus fermentans]|uniref:type II toxin-antitoxin system RelE/ParE family toxin n=1 Tax=Roseiarcus fermentans TaxID=1473586 RepID=UPI0014764DD5
MIVRFTERAESDLSAILAHLVAASPVGARNVAASLREALQVVADHPLGGKRTSRRMLFVKIVPRYPCKMFYRVGEDAVEIVPIRHASRRPWFA